MAAKAKKAKKAIKQTAEKDMSTAQFIRAQLRAGTDPEKIVAAAKKRPQGKGHKIDAKQVAWYKWQMKSDRRPQTVA